MRERNTRGMRGHHACVMIMRLVKGPHPHLPHPAVALSSAGFEPGPADAPLPSRHRNVCISSGPGESSGAMSRAWRVRVCPCACGPWSGPGTEVASHTQPHTHGLAWPRAPGTVHPGPQV